MPTEDMENTNSANEGTDILLTANTVDFSPKKTERIPQEDQRHRRTNTYILTRAQQD